MIKVLLLTAVAIYGLLYAANPKKFLERRGDREITPEMLRTARTAKGKSLTFEGFIIVGYLFGLAGKFLSGNLTYVMAFYLLDILMVTTDLLLTLRNRRLDAEEERRAKA